MSQIKSVARSVILFLFPRYPFYNALTFLLLLAERAESEKQPPFDPRVIYVHIGLCFCCAVGMGINRVRCFSAMVHTAHLLCFAFLIYMSNNMNYRTWVKARMACRMIGVAGFYLIYAYYRNSKPRPKWLKRTGEILVGVSIVIATYAVLQSPEDKEAFLKFVPGHQGSLFIYATLLAAVGLCYLPGQFVYDLTVILLVLLTFSTCLVDAQLTYWTKRRGLHYWNQIRLISDNVALIGGAILYLTCAKKKMPEDKID